MDSKATIGMTKRRKGLHRLMEKVYRERGFDFRDYKESTLTRRLERRLHARGVKSYADYACVLDKDPSEYDKLFDDLTIKVTSFFRDEVAFRTLEEMVIPTLIKRRIGRQKGLRIWSAGCAMGQEPYSIAMLFSEKLGPLDSRPHWMNNIQRGKHLTGLGKKINSQNLTILATDIHTKALEQAKEGVFARSEVEAIRPAWRKKYFIFEGNSFRVKPALKKLITFKAHNLVSGLPYQDLDLVVCRNVLIYFSLPLQMRVLRDFYDGLSRGGFLLLGKDEMPMGEGTVLFECVDKKAKLFKKAEIHPVRTSLRPNRAHKFWYGISKTEIPTTENRVKLSPKAIFLKEAEKAREKKKKDSKTRWITYHGKPYKEI